jgi:DNA invertase Pin-like site-specific DNA recombinase
MLQADQKVRAPHLGRKAYLYVRQSTMRQVFENTESSERQYALRRRAVALGWPEEQIVVVDCDQGQSAASVADREGFQRLVGEVGMARVGIVMGLEVSRLARNSSMIASSWGSRARCRKPSCTSCARGCAAAS